MSSAIEKSFVKELTFEKQETYRSVISSLNSSKMKCWILINSLLFRLNQRKDGTLLQLWKKLYLYQICSFCKKCRKNIFNHYFWQKLIFLAILSWLHWSFIFQTGQNLKLLEIQAKSRRSNLLAPSILFLIVQTSPK